MNILDILCFLFIGYFAYEDYKTRYISDQIALPLIIIGFIYLILTNPYYLWVPLLILIIGFFAYYTGMLGGGDTEILLIISTFMPYFVDILNLKIPFVFLVFFVAVLISSFVLPVLYLFKIGRKKEIILGIIISLITYLLFHQLFLSLTIFLLITFCLFMIEKEKIQKTFFVKTKNVKDLDFEDILCIEYDKNLKKFTNKKVHLPNEIKSLKNKLIENGVDQVLVYDDLPCFVPFIFISLLICYFIFFVFK